MEQSGATFNSGPHHHGESPLPLFRPEALVDQQQKFYGEVILIRPFSLMALGWLAAGIVAVALGFLLLGHYTEKARVTGVTVMAQSSSASGAKPQAEFFMPLRWARLLQPGESLLLRCRVCPSQFVQQTGTVLAISDTPTISPDIALGTLQQEPMYRVTVSLPPLAAQVVQISDSETRRSIEAEIPLGRKPLINWFFERSGS